MGGDAVIGRRFSRHGAAPDLGGYTIHRQRKPDALIEFLEVGEPRTSQALSDVLTYGLGPLRCRAWVVRNPRDEPCASVVLTRACFDRWCGHAFVDDPGAGSAVARVVDGSPTWSVAGTGTDIRPILPHLRRLRRVSALPWYVAEYPVAITGEPDASTRVATHADLDALVELYSAYELTSVSTRWQLRSVVRDWLTRFVVIVGEHDDAIVGAFVLSGRTSRYVVADALTVLPAHRNKGLGWGLLARAQAIVNGMGLSGTSVLAVTNPMSLPPDTLADSVWVTAAMVEPYRFRGEGRIRSLMGGLGRLDRREATIFRDSTYHELGDGG